MYLGIDKNSTPSGVQGYAFFRPWEAIGQAKCPEKNPYEEMRRLREHFYPGTEEIPEDGRRRLYECGQCAIHRPFLRRACGLVRSNGFGKWGMTTSMVAAKIVAAQIMGRKTPYEEVFTPQRFRPKSSGVTFLSHAGHSAAGLMKGAVPKVPGVLICAGLYTIGWTGATSAPATDHNLNKMEKFASGPAQESLPFIN